MPLLVPQASSPINASTAKLCHVQDVNVRKNQQMLSSFFFSACEVLNPGQQAGTPSCIPIRLMLTPQGQPSGSI